MESHFKTLTDLNSSVDQKYVAIFELKQLATVESVQNLMKAFIELTKLQYSTLLLHEIAYAMGQLPLTFSEQLEPFLISIINDISHDCVVRHEAAEALVNLAVDHNKEIYIQYATQENENDLENILSDTCKISLKKLETFSELKNFYGLSYNGTREPAAPFSKIELVEQLGIDFTELQQEEQNNIIMEYLQNPEVHIFNRYRCIYYIRNTKNPQLIIELTKLLTKDNVGALMKHEIAFIIGQLGHDCPQEISNILMEVCSDKNYPAIARHESLAAFQTIHPDKYASKKFLEQLLDDPAQIVRETSMVSLKLQDFW